MFFLSKLVKPKQQSSLTEHQSQSSFVTPVLSEIPLRREIANRYLVGDGIEIGGLNAPLEIPPNAKVRYLDRMSVADLRKQYPKLGDCPLIDVDIIDDGETLPSIADASLDFVIANHMIEHCQDPITSIKNWLRVLKPQGILYMAVPDKRYTFDCDRPITSIEHLIQDYISGPILSRRSHFEEWVRVVEKYPETEAEARIQYRMNMDFSIHFHVWTQADFLEFLLCCRQYIPGTFEIELMQKNGIEFILVLRRVELN